jgi:hypothetical protein
MIKWLRKAFAFTTSYDPLSRLADGLGLFGEQLMRLPHGTADLTAEAKDCPLV